MRRIAENGSEKTGVVFFIISVAFLFFASIAFVIGTESTVVASAQKSGFSPQQTCKTALCDYLEPEVKRVQSNRIRTTLHNQFSAMSRH